MPSTTGLNPNETTSDALASINLNNAACLDISNIHNMLTFRYCAA